MYRWLLLVFLSMLATGQWDRFVQSAATVQELSSASAGDRTTATLSANRYAYPLQAEKPAQFSGIHFSFFHKTPLPVFGAFARAGERRAAARFRQSLIVAYTAFPPSIRKAVLLFPFHHFW